MSAVALPPQHGAWAFLVVPLLVGCAVAGGNGWTVVFSLAWVVAYPATYFAGRAVTTRLRRGSWSRLARREAGRAAPWAVVLLLLGAPLVLAAPWLLGASALLLLLWAASLAASLRLGERSLLNDGLLVAQAVCAVPLVWALSTTTATSGPPSASTPSFGSAPVDLWEATAAVGLYLAGSVLHVKALLREGHDPRFHRADVAYHGLLCVVMGLVSPGWLIGFAPALARSVALRPGQRPAVIGVIELGVACAFVVAAFVVL